MDDLGQLLGKIQAQQSELMRRMDRRDREDVRKERDTAKWRSRMEKKVDSFHMFKLKIGAVSTGVAGLVATAFEIFRSSHH